MHIQYLSDDNCILAPSSRSTSVRWPDVHGHHCRFHDCETAEAVEQSLRRRWLPSRLRQWCCNGFAPWSQSCGKRCSMQRRRSGAEAHRVFRIDVSSEPLLEFSYLRPCRDPIGTQHFDHGIDVVIVDLLMAVRQQRLPHWTTTPD